MTYRVKIRQHPEPIAVEVGETILAAALRQGVPYPHGCQSGNCGSCKSHLHSGDVDLTPYSEFALTDEERSCGLILACRAVVWDDAEVAWLEADEVVAHPNRKLACTVSNIEDATHDIRRIRLRIDAGGPYTFSAGQYAFVTFGDRPAREYSMANRPDRPELEFHIRRISGGATSPYVANALTVGERVGVDGPYGTSYLRELHTGPIIAVAGGSGLAPVLSVVETALVKGMRQPITMFFGVRDERDVYMEDRLNELAARHDTFDFEIVLSEPTRATHRPTGFVHERVARRFHDFDGCKAYLAGPPPMVEAAEALLAGRGMLPRDIHADAFYTEADKPDTERTT
ncbi:MAG: 2Fe-2S iron-sulfur cluster-binding protein [Alphaproteobacteria bacterium]